MYCAYFYFLNGLYFHGIGALESVFIVGNTLFRNWTVNYVNQAKNILLFSCIELNTLLYSG